MNLPADPEILGNSTVTRIGQGLVAKLWSKYAAALFGLGRALGKDLREAETFWRGWRGETARAYRFQYGLFWALPIIWGCLEHFIWPRVSLPGMLAMAWFLEGRPGKRMAFQCLLFSVWSLYLGQAWAPPAAPPQNSVVELTGRIQGLPTLSPHCSFNLDTPHGMVKVQAQPPGFPLEPGQTLRIAARVKPPSPISNPGQFDYQAYLLSIGIREIYRADNMVLVAPPSLPVRMINRMRKGLDRALSQSVPASQAPLLKACLLGITEGLDQNLADDFQASGMLHILAISGQHIGLIALILLQLFSFLHLPRKAGFLVTALLLALYAPICGGSVSVLRSTLMFWCMLPAVFLERPGFTLNNLAWSAALSLVFMPYQILSLGFQLSYAATFFLILYSRPMAVLLKRARIKSVAGTYAVSTLALSLVIYLALYPVLASAVHMAAPSSLIGNLATIGLSSGMLVASCLTLLFHPLPWIPEAFGETAGAFSAGLSTCVHALAHGPGAARSISALPWAWSLLLIFLLVTFPFASRIGRGKVHLLLGLAAFSGHWAYGQGHDLVFDPASVAYLDVGQGDGMLLSISGKHILIDAGPIEAGRNVILPYLRHQGINRLDLVVVTHPDLDHYGGLAYIAERMDIGQVLYPGIESDAGAWKNLQATLAKQAIPLVPVHRGQILCKSSEAKLQVLSPAYPGQFPEKNDNSVVTDLNLGRNHFLFTGDIEAPAQDVLLSHPNPSLKGVILKVPHHGSDRSNPPRFLEAIRPDIAILSAGRKNRFGHPGPSTVQTLRNFDSGIFLTARQGAILFESDASHSSWRSYLERTGMGP